MTASTVSYSGQANGAGALDALQLKIFGGEVITSFNANTVFQDKQMIREISSGKSAQFPATGKITAGYHTPGSEILGTAIKHNERVIVIDDLLISHVFIANIDEAKNHYDVRAPYTDQLGDALAQAFDTNSAQVGYLAARASATITGQAGGTQVNKGATVATTASVIAAGLFTAAQTLDEANVPDKERYAFMKPAQYWLAAASTDLINKDWGGKGDIASGTFDSLAGLKIVKTNNLPNASVISTGPTAYQGTFTDSVILVMNKSAIGTVRLLNLALESEYQIGKQGTLMVAKYAIGHGILRPQCAVEITKA